jgi:small conductance mechanosensitive channel
VDPQLSSQADAFVRAYLLPVGWKLAGAAAVWLTGRWSIRLIRAALGRFMRARKVDTTLARYFDVSAELLLKLLVLIVVLGVLGIETTSFAALLAAAGLAIGAAWSGLLANFAAGVFLLTFRPFKVGDTIAAGNVLGTVREIGLFVTAIDTPDYVLTYVGNNKLFADTVQNFSANPFRRLDLSVQLPFDAKPDESAERLRARVSLVPNVLTSPAPIVEILSFAPTGTVLTVRPCCHNDDYWQVYFDTTRVISRLYS